MKALKLFGLIAVSSLLWVEVVSISTSVHASEQAGQNLQALSYRCADENGRNVVRLRITEENGLPSTMTVDQGNSVVDTYDISDSGTEEGGQSYTAYSGNSNATYKFIEQANGRGTFIFSLEDANGNQQVEDQKTCYKIG